MRRLSVIACLVGALFGGCGGDERAEAERTVRDFINATNRNDVDRLCGELVTQEYLEGATGATGEGAREACRQQLRSAKGIEVRLLDVRDTRIQDDRATLTAILESQAQRQRRVLRLEKEDGSWRIAGGSD